MQLNERSSHKGGKCIEESLDASEIREVLAALQPDPAPKTLWLSTRDHRERGVTGVDGYVLSLLHYWKLHPSPPEDVQHRLNVRKEQEAEQL